jgi:hypothetical protein
MSDLKHEIYGNKISGQGWIKAQEEKSSFFWDYVFPCLMLAVLVAVIWFADDMGPIWS